MKDQQELDYPDDPEGWYKEQQLYEELGMRQPSDPRDPGLAKMAARRNRGNSNLQDDTQEFWKWYDETGRIGVENAQETFGFTLHRILLTVRGRTILLFGLFGLGYWAGFHYASEIAAFIHPVRVLPTAWLPFAILGLVSVFYGVKSALFPDTTSPGYIEGGRLSAWFRDQASFVFYIHAMFPMGVLTSMVAAIKPY